MVQTLQSWKLNREFYSLFWHNPWFHTALMKGHTVPSQDLYIPSDACEPLLLLLVIQAAAGCGQSCSCITLQLCAWSQPAARLQLANVSKAVLQQSCCQNTYGCFRQLLTAVSVCRTLGKHLFHKNVGTRFHPCCLRLICSLSESSSFCRLVLRLHPECFWFLFCFLHKKSSKWAVKL